MKRANVLIALFIMIVLTFSLEAQEAAKNDTVPIMPRLPGCEQLEGTEQRTCQRKLLINYMNEQLVYPISAVREGKEGRVIVKTTIDSTGHVIETELIRSLFPPCDEEAKRLIQSIPKWLPAERLGVPVQESITIAILFRLENYYQKNPEHRPRFLPQTMDKSSRKKKRRRKIKAH